MYKASAGIALPTSIIGSLPRPAWYTAVLGPKSFLEAMVNSRYRDTGAPLPKPDDALVKNAAAKSEAYDF